jgi:hypothetical protein
VGVNGKIREVGRDVCQKNGVHTIRLSHIHNG